MNDAKRQRILDNIRKLQTKTTLMGCTEAEALAAAQVVGNLLDDYGLTMTDVELQSTECIADSVLSPLRHQSSSDPVLSARPFRLLPHRLFFPPTTDR